MSPTCVVVRPSVSSLVSCATTALATVISSPSRIQATPSATTMRVWNGDQGSRSIRAGMRLRMAPGWVPTPRGWSSLNASGRTVWVICRSRLPAVAGLNRSGTKISSRSGTSGPLERSPPASARDERHHPVAAHRTRRPVGMLGACTCPSRADRSARPCAATSPPARAVAAARSTPAGRVAPADPGADRRRPADLPRRLLRAALPRLRRRRRRLGVGPGAARGCAPSSSSRAPRRAARAGRAGPGHRRADRPAARRR